MRGFSPDRERTAEFSGLVLVADAKKNETEPVD